VNDLLILLGKRVDELRSAKKWSQEEFAHISGLHRTYIGQIERGEKNISFDNLSRVAGALGVNLSALLEGLENGAPTNPKSLQAETGWRRATAGEQLETQKLVKRLKIQHAEMSRTIQALENLPAKRGRRPERSQAKP
jgi:transcriptional regulator with XRE-family HTH domain